MAWFPFVSLPNAGETESERREKLRQQRADIARCWIKYCLNLLQDAKKLLEVRVLSVTRRAFFGITFFIFISIFNHVMMYLVKDNIGELNPDRQEELKRERRNDEEEEEKRRKSALLFGSEDTFDSIASQEEKVCVACCDTFSFFYCQGPYTMEANSLAGQFMVF